MLSQILALLIVGLMFVLIIWGKYPRHIVVLAASLAMIGAVFLLVMRSPAAVWEALSLHTLIQPAFWMAYGGVAEINTGINWSTVIFLLGMMVMVEEMSEAGFFDWLCLGLAKILRFRPLPLMLCFMILSAALSMFIDSITVILFLVVATVRLGHFLQFDPVPVIIAEIFAANLGGAATMSGDPPNIILGTSLGLSFWDFIQNNGVICFLGFILVLIYFAVCFRTKLGSGIQPNNPDLADLHPSDAIVNRRQFFVSILVFFGIILLIMTHTRTGLTMPAIGMLAIAATLVHTRDRLGVIRRVDWKTILFIIGLFVTVSGLEQTGVLHGLAHGLARLGGGSSVQMVVVLFWFTAITSAFVDNIPIATLMVPVVISLSSMQGLDLETLTWTLSKGTDIGGIATPIGASANVTGVALAAQEGHPISWKRYCKYAMPASVMVLVLSMFLIITMH